MSTRRWTVLRLSSRNLSKASFAAAAMSDWRVGNRFSSCNGHKIASIFFIYFFWHSQIHPWLNIQAHIWRHDIAFIAGNCWMAYDSYSRWGHITGSQQSSFNSHINKWHFCPQIARKASQLSSESIKPIFKTKLW